METTAEHFLIRFQNQKDQHGVLFAHSQAEPIQQLLKLEMTVSQREETLDKLSPEHLVEQVSPQVWAFEYRNKGRNLSIWLELGEEDGPVICRNFFASKASRAPKSSPTDSLASNE
jgi:hypothetical protein